MTRPPTRAKGANSDSEIDQFAEAIGDVTPLAPDHRGRVRAAPAVSSRQKPSAPAPSSVDRGDGIGAADENENEDGYVAPGVDRRELRKIKRGDYAAGNVLDLHGHTAAEAVASVKKFIDTERQRSVRPARYRCVCIVHGRGLHSKENVSVLKTRVRQYLRHHPAVLAYADAPRTDGGSGAVYVLLRK